jgi:enoyl-CoA hydratase
MRASPAMPQNHENPRRRRGFSRERVTGIEPATSSLGSLHSTTELHPRGPSLLIPGGGPVNREVRGPGPRTLRARRGGQVSWGRCSRGRGGGGRETGMGMTYSLEDGVAVIALDDGKANAFRNEVFEELGRNLDRAEEENARVLLIRGREGIFSGGLDIKWLPTLDRDQLRETVTLFGRTMLRVLAFPCPTIAEITGHAIAGGCVLACACDKRFALEGDYRLHMNEVQRAMAVPSWAITICGSAFPPAALTELLHFGEPFTTQRALEVGAINGLAPDLGALREMARAAAVAATAAGSGPVALTKQRRWGPELARLESLLAEDL